MAKRKVARGAAVAAAAHAGQSRRAQQRPQPSAASPSPPAAAARPAQNIKAPVDFSSLDSQEEEKEVHKSKRKEVDSDEGGEAAIRMQTQQPPLRPPLPAASAVAHLRSWSSTCSQLELTRGISS